MRDLPQTLNIQGAEVQRVEYRGEPVITFAAVDRVHQRPDGTAGRSFREHRSRFVLGEDFLEPTSDEIRRMSAEGIFPARSARGILLTRRGYLKLTKTMNDDRAWEVQGEMVDRYFAVEQMAEALMPQLSGTAAAREARLFMKQAMGLGKVGGLTGNQLLIAANRATRKAVGFDYLNALGLDHLIAPDNDTLLTATDLGRRLGGMSAIRVNDYLAAYDFQIGERDRKGRSYWLPTEKGIAVGAQMVDVERSNKTGQARQLRWPSRTVETLRDILAGEA
jgi:hypothetical protein